VQIDLIFEILIIGLSIVLLMWAAKHFYLLWYYGRKKEQINKLEARVAVLRMLLKSKLKRKGSLLQEQYKEDKQFLEQIFPKLELIGTYSFQRNTDYSEVISLLHALSEMIDHQIKTKTPEMFKIQNEKSEQLKLIFSHLPDHQKWIQLLKYDKGNLYIIKELVETQSLMKEKIDLYNLEQVNKDKKLRPVDVIDLSGYQELKVIVDADQNRNSKDHVMDSGGEPESAASKKVA